MNLNKFGEKRKVKEIMSIKHAVDVNNVYWLKTTISTDILEDEAKLVNLGVPEEIKVNTFNTHSTYPSI